MSRISDINLDKIVSDFKKIAQRSANEEEFRIHATAVIDENITSHLGLTIERREYLLVSGSRVDALYGRVLIEYEAPGVLSTTAGFTNAQERIINDIMTEAGAEERSRYFGIILSDKIVFVKFNTLSDEWVIRGPYEINKGVVLKIVEALRGLVRKKLCAEELLRDFGPTSDVASRTVTVLYDKLVRANSPKVNLLFEDWVRIFSQITGYKEEDLRGLDQFYDTVGKDYTKLLFCIHTYYALLMKIIAAELAYLYGAGRYLKSYVDELEDKYNMVNVEEFKDSIKDLEEGGLFKTLLKIRNFIEGGYFSWYLEEFDNDLMAAIAEIARKLSDYEPATPVLEPEETKDMLKIIYQELVPPPIRHNLGEYYTPDWLAQFLLDRVNFTTDFFEKTAATSRDLTKPLGLRLLDPACGSGTFLIEALKRLRTYAEEHYISDMMSEYVLENIIGIDLNPLAVLAARTNYLLNIGDLLSYTRDIELPIYLADSVTIKEKPTVYGNTYRIKTSAGEFRIPSHIVDEKGNLEELLRLVEECVVLKYSMDEFEYRIKKTFTDLNDSEIEGIKSGLYKLFLDLEEEGKDHIWITILLNAFAPLFIGRFDYVVGNPPWVLWDNLPRDYRRDTQELWKDYGLFTLTASQARHGGGKKDISILFTYVCADKYLKDSGIFGFLITQSVFKTKGAGEGFRRFILKDTDLKVVEAHDFVDVKPFEGTNNRTAAIILEKGKKTVYPTKYIVWRRLFDIDQKEFLETASKKLHLIEMAAIPSDFDNELSPWITVPGHTMNIVQKVYGKNNYPAYSGIYSGGINGVYWIRILDVIAQSRKVIDIPLSLRKILNTDNDILVRELLVENVTEGMKRKVEKVKAVLEDFFIYPLLKSRNVRKWKINGYNYSLQMQDPVKRIGFNESWLKVNFPGTYRYLKNFEEKLGMRKSRAIKQLLQRGPFYTMYAVGEYTYAPYKVVWNRMGSKIAACVISTILDKYLGEKLVLPENVLAFIPTDDINEAHYICSIMNSSITDMILRSIAGGTKSFGTPKIVEDTIRIPLYDENNELHDKLSSLSKKAHEIAQREGDVGEIEKEIDDLVSDVYGISEKNLQTVRKTLLIQEGEIPEEEEDVEIPAEKNLEVYFLNTVVEPMTENEVEVNITNPSRLQVEFTIDVLGEQIKLRTVDVEETFKLKIGPLEKGEYNLPYSLTTSEEKIDGTAVLRVKSVPKHRKRKLSEEFDKLLGEENE